MTPDSAPLVPGTVLSPRELARLAVHELGTVQCRCARPKQPCQTFCRACYYSLAPEMRRSLYDKIGQGYEAAYVAAVNMLVHLGRVQRPEWLTEGPSDAS
jgi:hypothetical protein